MVVTCSTERRDGLEMELFLIIQSSGQETKTNKVRYNVSWSRKGCKDCQQLRLNASMLLDLFRMQIFSSRMFLSLSKTGWNMQKILQVAPRKLYCTQGSLWHGWLQVLLPDHLRQQWHIPVRESSSRNQLLNSKSFKQDSLRCLPWSKVRLCFAWESLSCTIRVKQQLVESLWLKLSARVLLGK